MAYSIWHLQEVYRVADVVNIVDLRRKKEAKNLGISVVELNDRLEGMYREYISIMKLVVKGQSIRMGDIVVDVFHGGEFTLTDSEGKAVEYLSMFGPEADEIENEDLLINSLTYLAPSKITIKNPEELDKHVVYALSQIFHERIQIDNQA